MRKIFSTLVLIISMFTFSNQLFASHTAGGELIYKKVPGTTNSYTFYFKFYRNCANNGTAASAEPASFTLCYTSPCTGTIQQIVMPKMVGLIPTTPPVQNGTTLSNGCDSTITQCEVLSSAIPGYEQWWYSATISLPVTCNDWRFWINLCCRNNNILNLGPNVSSTYDIYVETRFDNLNAPLAQDNSSPYFLNSNSSSSLPIPYMCVNSPYFHNGGAADPDGDSLHFELINPRDGAGCVATTPTSILAAGYNLNSVAGQPMACNNTFNLDPNTGNFSLTPNVIGKFVISIKCSEYRNGILLGSIMRDMQVVVDNCIQMPVTTVIDSVNIINGTAVVDTVKTCPGNNLDYCFDIKSAVSGVYVKHMFDNAASSFPGSTITFSNPFDSILHVCMTWQPTISDTGWHTLFVNVKDSLNCLSTPAIQNITLYVHKPIKASNDTTICAGQTIKLWATGNSGFTWNVSPGGSNMSTLNCLTGKCDTVNVSPMLTTSYVVTDTVCGYQDTIVVGIIQGPTVTISPDTTTCVNSSLQIGVNALPNTQPYNYSWVPTTGLSSSTIANPTVFGNQMAGNTTYTVTVSAQGIIACPSVKTITIDLLGGFNILNPVSTVCEGDAVQITSTGGNPKYTFSWTPTTFVTNPNILNTTITPTPYGLYPYTVKASYPGCPDSSQSIVVNVEPIPIVNAGLDREICSGDTVHLLGTVLPANGTYSYQWSPASDLNDGTILNPVFDGLNSTVFTLTATTPLGCQGSETMAINLLSVNFMNLNGDRSLCPNTPTTLTAGGALNYLWSPAYLVSDSTASTVTVSPSTTTTFYVYGTDNKGCKDTLQATVVINPSAVINLGPSQTIYPGQSAQLYANGNCSYFTFTPPFGLSATNIKDPVAQPAVTTRYYVTGITEEGCVVNDSIDIIVSPESYIEMANAFSPGSGTSINDEYKIILKGQATLNTFKIFNRWGELVFSTTDINKGWNGQYKNKPQPMGSYIYVVEAVTPTGKRFNKQGNVTLIR